MTQIIANPCRYDAPATDLHDGYRKTLGQLQHAPAERFDELHSMFVSGYPQGRMHIYIIDSTGRQVSNTTFKKQPSTGTNHALFHPAARVADHALKTTFTA